MGVALEGSYVSMGLERWGRTWLRDDGGGGAEDDARMVLLVGQYGLGASYVRCVESLQCRGMLWDDAWSRFVLDYLEIKAFQL